MEDWREAYDYTMADIGNRLSCPQCGAIELLRAIMGQGSAYAMGQRVACREIIRQPHRCGKPTRMVRLAAD